MCCQNYLVAIVLALRKLKQENYKFEISQDYIYRVKYSNIKQQTLKARVSSHREHTVEISAEMTLW